MEETFLFLHTIERARALSTSGGALAFVTYVAPWACFVKKRKAAHHCQ